MKIDRIRLKNFRSHKHTVIQLERVNFIRGMNRTGKSSIGMAIEMALSGRCSVTDEGGKGFEQLIRDGEQTAVITLECSPFDAKASSIVGIVPSTATITLTLDRSTGRTFKIETGDRTILGRQAQEWIAENIAAPDVVNASLNAWRFMDLSDNDQASLLARVLLPAKLELDAEVSGWLAGSRLSVVERPTLFATIEATHKSIAAARTDVNRKLRDLKAIQEPLPIAGNSATVKAQIYELQNQQAQANATLERIAKDDAVRAAALEQKQQLQLEIAEKHTVLSAAPATMSAKQRGELEAISNRAPRKRELTEKLSAERIELANVQETIRQLESNTDKVCPTCKAPLTEEKRTKIFGPYFTRQNDLYGSIKLIEKELKAIVDPDAALSELAMDKAYAERYKHDQQQLNDLMAKRDAIVISEAVAPADALREQVADLKAKIVKGLDALVHVVALEEQHSAYQKQLKERQRAERQAQELENLLEYFGPHGIKAKLIAERLDVFTQRINEVLLWWGYSLAFSIEPYVLHVTEAGSSSKLTPRQLSASERYRLGVAFAIAITEWTGFRLLIADGADILDKDHKWQLAEAIFQSDLDQAIVTSTGVAGTFSADATSFFTLSKVDCATVTQQDAIQTPVVA